MLIKLTSPQAGWLSIFFEGKSVVLHLLEGPELRTRYWEDRKEKKVQHLVEFKPTTTLLRGLRSTTVQQPLPSKWNYFTLAMSAEWRDESSPRSERVHLEMMGAQAGPLIRRSSSRRLWRSAMADVSSSASLSTLRSCDASSESTTEVWIRLKHDFYHVNHSNSSRPFAGQWNLAWTSELVKPDLFISFKLIDTTCDKYFS